ncbi:DUF4129 domain-containing protein [Pseudomonas sp. RIT-PI-AD]|uniref:DUF4129 domain-containing protein n=1 Tax=Pseudomonas sp. RIT-PI-AD TaxID=3035294 RepID=UPI0021DB15A6|nr:DUF4129 domain-containing protein [Pseudomonas sp. RIT-PI-AD]
MRLTDASVAIRPRSAWEAMDLGVLLARRHAGLLMGSWALLTLPVFVLLSALFWTEPSWAMFLFWLLKPAFDRLPLYILSHALFDDTPSLKSALKALPRLLKPQLLASLTWRRLSLTRSFDLPVLQLEGLAGQARGRRLAVLGLSGTRAASWLTIIGAHLEWALWFGLITLLYLLLPQQLKIDMDWQKLIDVAQGDWLWLEHLSNSLYALLLIVWEPVYVACGFTLYLNRRTELEAWDIELVFRRLRQRLTGIAYAVLLGCAALLAMHPGQRAMAEEHAQSCPLPSLDASAPQAARLTRQALTSQAAQGAIAQILDAPPFQHRETVTRWHFGDEPAESADAPPGMLARFFQWLAGLGELSKGLANLAVALKVLLWALLIGALALLLWRYREWWFAFARRVRPPRRTPREAPGLLFGLEVAPESLPDDVAAEVERLWGSQPREALGLLYRALLSRLLHEFHLPLKSAHTEGEVLALQQGLQRPELDAFARLLTQHWQALAYGHRMPPESLRERLCADWRRLDGQAPA